MSVKLKNSDKALDRPFSREVIAAARELTSQYQIILNNEDGHWYGRGLELPNVFGDGSTSPRCVKDTREAFITAVASMIEEGQKPPSPAKQGARAVQVNIRLTQMEKTVLEAAAKNQGFRSVSDFMRNAALASQSGVMTPFASIYEALSRMNADEHLPNLILDPTLPQVVDPTKPQSINLTSYDTGARRRTAAKKKKDGRIKVK